jgi:hypothetical protein
MKRHLIPFKELGIESTSEYPDAAGTEGPWEFNEHRGVVTSVHPRTGMRPAGDPFPTVCRMAATYTPQLVDGYLIAAAPELYAAAVDVLDSFEAYMLVGEKAKPEDEWDEYDTMMAPKWRALKAAIDKAVTPHRGNND